MCAATASSAANVTSNDYRRAETSETERHAVLRDALEATRAISDDSARARALADFAPDLPETLLRDALEAARAISDDSARARALACLAPHLPESLLNRLEANSSCNP